LTIGDNGELVVGQQLTSPSVYLDHWALRKVSDNEAMGQRIAQALRRRGGTLALSWANIAEFQALDAATARRAEDFIEGNLRTCSFKRIDDRATRIPAQPRAAYCDFVLLDGRWRDQVDRLRARLARVGAPLPIASAFSGAGAIDVLAKVLES
jgi:hypothetical protein